MKTALKTQYYSEIKTGFSTQYESDIDTGHMPNSLGLNLALKIFKKT